MTWEMNFQTNFEVQMPTVSGEEKNYCKPIITSNHSKPSKDDQVVNNGKIKSSNEATGFVSQCGTTMPQEVPSPSSQITVTEPGNDYGIPKGINNKDVLKNSANQTSMCSPTNQPLLPTGKVSSSHPNPKHSTPFKKVRTPPSMIVVSSSEDHEKVKVIFEYEKERGKLKHLDGEGYEVMPPNLLVRNKRPILISAFVILIFLLFSAFIAIHFALKKTKKQHM